MWMLSWSCRTAIHRQPPGSLRGAMPVRCITSRATCAHSGSVSDLGRRHPQRAVPHHLLRHRRRPQRRRELHAPGHRPEVPHRLRTVAGRHLRLQRGQLRRRVQVPGRHQMQVLVLVVPPRPVQVAQQPADVPAPVHPADHDEAAAADDATRGSPLGWRPGAALAPAAGARRSAPPAPPQPPPPAAATPGRPAPPHLAAAPAPPPSHATSPPPGSPAH